jgi:segregation and condensation protein B
MTETTSLARALEAVLFVAHEPISLAHLAAALDCTEADLRPLLISLQSDLASRGWRLSVLHSQYQLVTAPEADAVVRRYLQTESRSELSKAALETLAIIAYRGPLTRSQLEELRGVSSETMLRNLLQRELIQEAGPAAEPGRPMRYQVSQAFLRHFGLESLDHLPPLPKPEAA